MFQCEHSNADGLSWLVNGTALRSQPDLHITFRESTSGRVWSLTVTALSRYNSTTIECVAFFSNDQPSARTPPALLHIQGILNAPSSLTLSRSDTVIISWSAPPTLDLINVEPDIIYCVEIHNITCGVMDLLVQDCSVTEPFYTNSLLTTGYVYRAVITPRSNVIGAANGTSSSVTESFPTVDSYTVVVGNVNDTFSVAVEIYLVVHDSDTLLPSTYALLLVPVDDPDNSMFVETTNQNEGLDIVLTPDIKLKSRCLWTYTVFAYGCIQHPITRASELSTHDIQNILVTTSSTQPGGIRVTGDLIEGSTAASILVIIYSLSGSESDDVLYIQSSISEGGNVMIDVGGLRSGLYGVSAFVILEDGLPFTKVATKPRLVSVTNSALADEKVELMPDVVYTQYPRDSSVCITCTFLENSTATDCVAVVHQRISQLNSSAGLMNIESSYKFTRSGDTASGCIEGVNLEDYQVGVIGGRQLSSESPKEQACEECIISGSVLGTATSATILSVLFVGVYIFKRRGCGSCDNQPETAADVGHVELRRCAAYEVTALSKKKVVMESNPAYRVVTPNV